MNCNPDEFIPEINKSVQSEMYEYFISESQTEHINDINFIENTKESSFIQGIKGIDEINHQANVYFSQNYKDKINSTYKEEEKKEVKKTKNNQNNSNISHQNNSNKKNNVQKNDVSGIEVINDSSKKEKKQKKDKKPKEGKKQQPPNNQKKKQQK